MKNNNIFRWKRTARGVSIGLLLMCNNTFAQVQEEDQNTFTLNLQNTDIHSLIATVSKQTGTNFVVDPRVKAKVTVISTDPVSADGLYEVFLSVLQVHGYSAVPAGDLIKIVPDVTAKQGPVPILGDELDTSDQLVTQVITVVNVPAAQLVPILRPMVPQQGHLAAYAATNSLIITDRASNIHRLMEIIRRIDRPDNEEIEVVRLNHASASEIVGTLSSLQRNNIGGPQGPGAMQLVADERTNSVLISGDRAVRVRIRGLIAHLDTPIESGGNTRVVYLKFANAEDMVTILQGVSQGQARVGATTADGTGGGVQQQTFNQPVQNTGQGQQVPNNPAVNNQNPNAVTARSAAETGESNVDIQADPNTNALIITAPQDEMQNILAVIRQLDIRRAQVLVEAVIAEITEDNTREFGINFLLDGSDKDVPIGFSNLGGATDGLLGIAGAASAGGVPSTLGAGLSLALGRFATGEIDFGFLVRAIASDADNNILSTPSIVTLDNEEAEIVVGSNVPFVTGTQLSANNNNPFQTIEREDIGLTLKVTPQINDGNTIKMDLEQEVSNVNTTALTGAADITTNVRSIKTTVLVEDGQTLVLGGLIDDQFTDVEQRVPLLGDIPILGRLFRYRSTTKNKRNLMIFLHPQIMRDSETASQFSNSKYNFLRSRQMLYRQQADQTISKDKQDDLPELKLYFEGKDADSPLTQFDSPGFNSDNEPLRLTDAAVSSLVSGNGTPVIVGAAKQNSAVSNGPSKTDIESVIATYSAEQAEQVLTKSVPLDAAAAPALQETVNTYPDITDPDITYEGITDTGITETEIAETEAPPVLPVVNEALVSSVLQADIPEPEIEKAPVVKVAEPEAVTADDLVAELVQPEQLPEIQPESQPESQPEQPQRAPALVIFEETIVSDEDPDKESQNIKVSDEEVESPVQTITPEEDSLVAEVPASSKPIVIEPVADELLADTDALFEESALSGDYIDNVDSDIVDRSQDDLADDRPEVFLMSVTAGGTNSKPNGQNMILPEMQSAPRY